MAHFSQADESDGDYYYVHEQCIEQSEIPTHRDSPVALFSSSGTVLERYEYDAYGYCRVLHPTTYADDPDGISEKKNPYLFTGRRLDILDRNSLIIQYNRNRCGETEAGR